MKHFHGLDSLGGGGVRLRVSMSTTRLKSDYRNMRVNGISSAG